MPQVQFSLYLKKFSEEKIVNVTEVNQRRCLEQGGQWLENVDQTHLVQASNNLELLNVISCQLKTVRCQYTQE